MQDMCRLIPSSHSHSLLSCPSVEVDNYETDMRSETFHARLEEASVSVSRLQEASLGG